jgi:hypothetical protein
MAKDYRKYNHLDNFELKVIEANKADGLYFTGRTGYEQYYIDMSLWRDLYNPNSELLFNEQIDAKEVNKYTLLLDDNVSNDDKDSIYIKNGYSLVAWEDKDNITY